ncbi:MAG: biotin/lipoyl-binding protein [Chloroflexi bacterium]|nr:biotin/lipoyl-binding protein [Chloroflexota bacterium]
MPAFDVNIHGKTYRVEVPDPGATPLQVIVDGEIFEVGIVGTEIDAAPTPGPVEPPRPASTPARQPARSPAPAAAAPVRPAPTGGNGGQEIAAPMPGTILSIEVTVGQSVEIGQVVCVLEAMKMKNPIRATQAGTVTEILVQPGQTVPHGALLARLA